MDIYMRLIIRLVMIVSCVYIDLIPMIMDNSYSHLGARSTLM